MPEEIDVAYVAKLARVNLTAEEIELFQKQLAQVLSHAEKLKTVDVSGVEAAALVAPMCNVLRADEARGSLTAEEALRNAPAAADGLFIVTKVLE